MSDAARRPFCLAPERLRHSWRWPSRERSADIRTDLSQVSNAGQRQKIDSNAAHSSISTVS
jgi:hypothetical protein